MKKCQHQFFETNKVISEPGDRWDILTNYKNFGVQVICALCGQRRQLMDNGQINIFDKKRLVWISL